MAAGVRVAAPVIAALLLSNLVTGLISRTLPQINVLAIGLSINALAMLVVLALTIGSAGLIFQNELTTVALRLSRLW
jgi:flagellar biosynthetic protein FliR